ncbi:Ger(x)C family spore germination C-terminal domain-containing protein [Brevibacillus composti]|uniref:Ger(x)C family spore germination C-terminal domain-containing protein n=1 Tax=Brevibacillus composti TaxID=2796470 RepID=UPI001E283901|nr:Ger(x)C family spore germination C-terminal domain-containing protein [Brevibacillus composti]
MTVGGKIQIIALSKRLVQHPDWYTLLDTIYRDPRLTINARIVVVDGPLHEIFHLNPPDKPRLPIHLTQLLDTANRRNLTVKTSALELQRMMNDKGTTPVVTEFKKVILRFGKKGELTIVSKIPDHLNKNRWLKPLLSYFVKYVDKEVKTSYQDNQFHFDVELKMEISISERYSSFDVATHKKELEQVLEKDLSQRYQKLIATFQKHQVDPVGFGVYARAYQYKEWKKVEEDWPKAFAHAKVRIKPIVSIKGFGVIE